MVNPSGGLEAKGHPLGATGLGMHFYIASEGFFSIESGNGLTEYSPVKCNSENVSDRVRGRLESCLIFGAGAGPMQAPGLFDIPDKRGKYGLVQNIGLGGAVVCSLLRRPEFYKTGGQNGKDRHVSHLLRAEAVIHLRFFRLGYNHAHECRPITLVDVDKVKSKKSSPFILAQARL